MDDLDVGRKLLIHILTLIRRGKNIKYVTILISNRKNSKNILGNYSQRCLNIFKIIVALHGSVMYLQSGEYYHPCSISKGDMNPSTDNQILYTIQHVYIIILILLRYEYIMDTLNVLIKILMFPTFVKKSKIR